MLSCFLKESHAVQDTEPPLASTFRNTDHREYIISEKIHDVSSPS